MKSDITTYKKRGRPILSIFKLWLPTFILVLLVVDGIVYFGTKRIPISFESFSLYSLNLYDILPKIR